MKALLKVIAFIVISVVAQVAWLLMAGTLRQEWLMFPLMPGLKAMKLLPADPQTAGSFIVFPTLAQTLLALAVNTAVFAIVWFAARKWRRSKHPERSEGSL